jgi:hypothetical protein
LRDKCRSGSLYHLSTLDNTNMSPRFSGPDDFWVSRTQLKTFQVFKKNSSNKLSHLNGALATLCG